MAAPLQCFLGTYEGELFGWTISPSGAASVDASHELTCAVKAHDASMRTSTTVRRGNSSMLLTSASDGSVKIYDLRASREVGTLLVEVRASPGTLGLRTGVGYSASHLADLAAG